MVVSGSVNGSTLYAVRETDGALLWTYDSDDSSSPPMTTDAIFLHDNCGQVFRLQSSTGFPVWTVPGMCGGGGNTSMSILGGNLYVTDVYAFSNPVLDPSTGTQVGTFDGLPTPVAAGGVGYFFPYGQGVLAAIPLGATTPIWSRASTALTPPIVVGPNVVTISSTGVSAYATADGGLVSSISMSVSVNTSEPGLQEADGVLVAVAGQTLLAY